MHRIHQKSECIITRRRYIPQIRLDLLQVLQVMLYTLINGKEFENSKNVNGNWTRTFLKNFGYPAGEPSISIKSG